MKKFIGRFTIILMIVLISMCFTGCGNNKKTAVERTDPTNNVEEKDKKAKVEQPVITIPDEEKKIKEPVIPDNPKGIRYCESLDHYEVCGVCGEYTNDAILHTYGIMKTATLVLIDDWYYEVPNVYEIEDNNDIICRACAEKGLKNPNSALYKIYHYNNNNVGDTAYSCGNCAQLFGNVSDNPHEISCPECGNSYDNKLTVNNTQVIFIRMYPIEEYLYQ